MNECQHRHPAKCTYLHTSNLSEKFLENKDEGQGQKGDVYNLSEHNAFSCASCMLS
jgi:hypothetical protein